MEVQVILDELAGQLTEWVGFDGPVLDVAHQCDLAGIEHQILELHGKLVEEGDDFSRSHIDTIRGYFKAHPEVKDFLKCMTEKRKTENKFFK